jgi:hypothetical protein
MVKWYAKSPFDPHWDFDKFRMTWRMMIKRRRLVISCSLDEDGFPLSGMSSGAGMGGGNDRFLLERGR